MSVADEAACRYLARIQRGLWIHEHTPRPPIAQSPHRVVHTHDKLVVRAYPPAEDRRERWPVVIVPSMINRATICDLEPGRSLVQGLAQRGHRVYLVDWGVPGREDADEDVAYVLYTLLHHSIARIARHAGADRVHLFGYCMGGTLAAMYAALRPRRIGSVCALAAPVHFAHGGRLRQLVQAIDVDRAFPRGTLVPVSAMQPAFQLLDPITAWTKYADLDAAAARPDRLRRAMVRERWLEEGVPIPSAFARQFVRHTYQRDDLIAGAWRLGDARIDLSDIACPVLVCACQKDRVAPHAAVAPLADVVPRGRLETLEAGHVGVVVGATGPQVFYPLLSSWLREVSP